MSMGLKIAGTAVLALSGMAAGKLVEKIWERVTKNPVPREDDESVSLVQLVVFAALSAAIVALVQHFSIKKMNQLYDAHDSNTQVNTSESAPMGTAATSIPGNN